MPRKTVRLLWQRGTWPTVVGLTLGMLVVVVPVLMIYFRLLRRLARYCCEDEQEASQSEEVQTRQWEKHARARLGSPMQ